MLLRAYSSCATERIIFPLFLLVLVWAPLPLGSNRVWSSMALLIVSATLLTLLLIKYYTYSFPYTFRKGRWPLLCLLLVQLVVTLQVIPFGASGAGTIHLSPFQGVIALFQGLSYCCAFVLTLLLVTTKNRLKWFVYAVIFSALLQGSYGMANVFFEWNYLFVIKKDIMHDFTTGTFINRNHLAGYLNIGLSMAVGWLLFNMNNSQWQSHRVKHGFRVFIDFLFSQTLALRVAVLLIVLALIMTHSRAGNLAFMLALCALSIIYFYRNKSVSAKFIIFFISFVIIDALLIGHWFGVEYVVDRVGQTALESESRANIGFAILPVVKDYFWFGSGMDSFEVFLPMHIASQAHVAFEHAHNDFLELFVSLGIFGFLILGAFIVFIARDNWQKHKPQYGVFMLIISVAILSLFDFNLFIPAFAYTLCACLATVYYSKAQEKKYEHE